MNYIPIYVRQKFNRIDIIRYQLVTYCFINKINLSISELDCLAQLSLMGKTPLNVFCIKIAALSIFNSSQTVRNAVNRAIIIGLVIKEGKKRKTVFINPSIKLQTTNNILLDYKFICNDSN